MFKWVKKIKDFHRKYFKKRVLSDFPKFPPLKKWQPLTIILEAGSNSLTKWGMVRLYDWPYKTIFTHAFMHIQYGQCLNVGASAFVQDVGELLKKSHRYIALRFTDLTPEQTTEAIKAAYLLIGHPKYKFRFYDVGGFANFGTKKIPWLRELVKPSKKSPFCSDALVDVFQFPKVMHKAFIGVDSEATSPCHLFKLLAKYKHIEISEIIIP